MSSRAATYTATEGTACISRALSVFGGQPSPTLAAPLGVALFGVVLVQLGPDEASPICTGVAWSERHVLTAGHCVDFAQRSGVMPTVISEIPTECESTEFGVTSMERHPELDLGLLVLEADLPTAALGIPWMDALHPEWVGAPAELAGYGLTEAGAARSLRYASESIVELDEQFVVVDGEGQSGACDGDSGGPLFARGDNGTIGVIGLLDDGDPTCVGRDYYTRGELIVTWDALPAASAPPVEQGCAGLDWQGVCLRNRAMWCTDFGELQVRDCSAEGALCSWSPSDDGHRCAPLP